MASAALTDAASHAGIGFQTMRDFNDTQWPAGCFYFDNHHEARFNNAKSGKANSAAYRICARESWEKCSDSDCLKTCVYGDAFMII